MRDTYQWFFPLGIVFGVLGVGVWILFWLQKIHFYPSPLHSELMIGGFFLTVAIGFLMTAIPRFTNTHSASFMEIGVAFLIALFLLVSAFLANRFWFYLVLFLEILLLVRFAVSRFFRSLLHPPPSFVLVGFGIFLVLLATFLLLLQALLDQPLAFFSQQFLWHGFPLFLILGIGTRLIPFILGTTPKVVTPLQAPTPFSTSSLDKKGILRFGIYGLLILLSFPLETSVSLVAGKILRAGVVTFILFTHWRIYLLPRTKAILGWALWISAWMLVVGSWLPALLPTYAVHAAHIYFIGTVSLMIFAVATRVVVSHGKHDSSLEIRSKALLAMLIFFVLALVIRFTAPWSGNYFSHLAFASFFWLAAVFSWSVVFLKKVLIKKGLS
ncbi:MAG: hypothetical protein A2W61_02930 [Deltaproteobacteria bacterium RIFCSPLOWO2_01_44_7]|nr:MAG: hypothetical protein A2712_07465 [Deltaproteobacteria bacterium RIFCSPHIGHO2_01_FULL_43_49]OGQ14818.1 MAG: hypothetical protein A3D22_09530 [Deltaproteobacteria bacterium RIFCSPHIGHO2_02_FULL_44_53]OGQ28204.1 MAG: hypothetical protein A3D98_08240 [Deltaproteobacteria bacterium RIFCSPHIGHO2_12_FULL_44_21]OGQ31416.1 MAG: hypothetical protein A2979_08290 [Deltaproteobacteria bacterium RIFCSPLOWO2_01_FULL_45_74]OGQ38416.1 MAG: hypothetical protein A2W61_02930 [Deltaproteobacteria bacterium 